MSVSPLSSSLTASFAVFPRLQAEQLLQLRDDLGDEFPRFVSLFTEHSQHLLKTAQQSLMGHDLTQAKIALHSFKGMSGTMGAERLFQLCKEAEAMAGNGELKTLEQLIANIEIELPELDKEIEQILNR